MMKDSLLNLEPLPSGAPVLSVTELSFALKKTVETSFGFIKVRGEISGSKLHTSGHLYFALKDKDSVLDAICWRGSMGKFTFKPTDGLEVICHGRLTTYGARSKYQMIVEHMEIAGMGALLKLLQERKERLAREGLFDLSRKKKLPFLPQIIGIITSPTGAVIQDILHRLRGRFPRHVLLWPVAVQGEAAAPEIARAIEGFNALPSTLPRPDVLIVARGGGSLEDLWAFNEEVVVRAAAQSSIPLISAVGHETDTTLIDYAADCRAPTPSAAAEMAVPVLADILEALSEKFHRLQNGILRQIRHQKMILENRTLRSPKQILENKIQLLDDRFERLNLAMTQRLHQIRFKYERAASLLESYSYTKTLERGFVLVKDERGHPVTSSKTLDPQAPATLQFYDGVRDVALID